MRGGGAVEIIAERQGQDEQPGRDLAPAPGEELDEDMDEQPPAIPVPKLLEMSVSSIIAIGANMSVIPSVSLLLRAAVRIVPSMAMPIRISAGAVA
jgi:hypothetical protein